MQQASKLSSHKEKIAVIGLGYVGLPLAVEFGKKRPVVGFDVRPDRIEELRAGQDSTREVSANELAAASQLSYSSSIEDLRDCGVFVVAVPTPIDRANRPDLTLLERASETVGRAMSVRTHQKLRNRPVEFQGVTKRC